MTFAAPMALGVAAAAALGVVLWHLIATQRPEPELLPTARFVPVGEARAASRASRPTDLLLLALRVLALIALGAAFAGPRPTHRKAGMVRVLVADRSRAAQRDVGDSVRALWRAGDVLVWFDSTAASAEDSVTVPEPSQARGRLATGLVRAHQRAVLMGERSDSLELVIVSPLERDELDASVMPLLGRWPGRVRVVRTSARRAGASIVRAVIGPLSGADSAAARAGATVVWWPSAAQSPVRPEAVWSGDITFVAPLSRVEMRHAGAVTARWSDGAAAASESAVGAGCIRSVSIGVPTAGDAMLQPSFRALDRQLHAPCGAPAPLADSGMVRRMTHEWTSGPHGAALRPADPTITLLLLALGAVALLVELMLRRERGVRA